MTGITVFDYGGGNLKSVFNAFKFLGFPATATSSPGDIRKAERLVLPGVSAFGDCAAAMRKTGAADAVREFIESGKPYLGICLGMHILFSESEESPGEPGLSVFEGRVVKLPSSPGIKVPHMGWNRLETRDCAMFGGVENGSWLYFAHSFHAAPEDDSIVAARTEHGVNFTAAVEKNNVFACQFHPERSSSAGLEILRNFALFQYGL